MVSEGVLDGHKIQVVGVVGVVGVREVVKFEGMTIVLMRNESGRKFRHTK